MTGRFGKAVTRINDIVARAASLLIYPMMFLLFSEMVTRFVAWKSLLFAYDITWMSFAAFVFVGGGYALSHDVHIKADLFYNRMGRRAKRRLTFFSYAFFFFLPMAAILYSSFRMLIKSIVVGEYANYTPWAPPVWPVRIVLCFGFILLALQGIVKFSTFLKETGGEDTCPKN